MTRSAFGTQLTGAATSHDTYRVGRSIGKRRTDELHVCGLPSGRTPGGRGQRFGLHARAYIPESERVLLTTAPHECDPPRPAVESPTTWPSRSVAGPFLCRAALRSRSDIAGFGSKNISYGATGKPQRPHLQRLCPKHFRGDGLRHELEMLQRNRVGFRRSHRLESFAQRRSTHVSICSQPKAKKEPKLLSLQ